MKSSERGTSNTNDRGSSYARRARKRWLAQTYGDGKGAPCYRCGKYLPLGPKLEADRIIPGELGGRYIRSNIRPCCGHCNIITGNKVRDLLRTWVDPDDPEGREELIWLCIDGKL